MLVNRSFKSRVSDNWEASMDTVVSVRTKGLMKNQEKNYNTGINTEESQITDMYVSKSQEGKKKKNDFSPEVLIWFECLH